MFGRIARRYDLVNTILSFGQDARWRRKLGTYLPAGDHLRLLDLACGTGAQLLALAPEMERLEATGIDLSPEMLEVGRIRLGRAGLANRARLLEGDATRLDFPDASFDAVTISFGIRNVGDANDVLREAYRVLKPRGRFLILEFSLPENGFLRAACLGYLVLVVSSTGGLLTGQFAAYRYLSSSIREFADRVHLAEALTAAGFKVLAVEPLTFGAATIHVGEKP